MGAERVMLSNTQANGKAPNSDEFDQWNRAFLDQFFLLHQYPPWYHWVFTGKQVRNVLSSLHFHFVDLCQQRTERTVVKENIHLHDKNLVLCKISETGKRLHMRTSIGCSLSKLI